MSRVVAGIYGDPAPTDIRRLEAALGPGGRVDTVGALAVGWSAPLDAVLRDHGCVIDGSVDGSDATAIGAAYARSGTHLLDDIGGHFTLAVWNRAGRDGLLAVDQLGVSPLHVYESGRRLYFASEIRDLLRLLPWTPEPERRYLAFYIGGEPCPEHLTPYAGIRRLPGGHAVELDDGSWRIRPYWQLRYTEPSPVDRNGAATALRDGLERAVAKRLEPGRTGILLSGGVDSTAIAGVSKGILGERPMAYSAVFPGNEAADESRLLEEMTGDLGVPWKKLVVRRASVLRDALTYTREWQVPSTVPNLYFLLKLLNAAAGDGVRVVLDGEGGDELLGCVPYAAADRLRAGDAAGAIRLVRNLPWDGTAQPWKATYHLLNRFGLRGALPHAAHYARRRDQGGAPWLSELARATLSAERDLWAWKRADGPRWWTFLSDLVTRGRTRFGVHDTLRRIGEMTGVERRHPLLDDLELIELVLGFPPELSFDPRYTRPLLRDAVAGLVPDSVRLRTQKADFGLLIRESFAGPEREAIASLVLARDARIRPFISQSVAADAVNRVDHPRFVPYQGALLRMVTAECWLRMLDDPQFPDRLLERGLPSEDVELVSPEVSA